MATVTEALWQLADTTAGGATVARAACDVPLSVDLLQPERGVNWNHGVCRFLGVQVDEVVARSTLVDAYARVTDLVATYQAHSARPHRLQLYWALPTAPISGVRGLVDLQVLTQTDLLDSDPRRSTHSELPLGDVWRLTAAGTTRVTVQASAATSIDGAAGLPCVLVRPTQANWSYVELVPPADFCATEIGIVGDKLSVRQALFVDFLEKGVILRSRVRGAIVDREQDESLARALYRDLCAAPPPLAT